MKSLCSRALAAALLALVAWLLLAGASGSRPLQADKLVIIGTTDVKGETSPCG